VIAARGVAVGYGARTVLRDIDLTLRAGELVAVVGANGSGKSTLLRTLAGAQRTLAGTVSIDGTAIADMKPRVRAQHVALVAAEEIADATTFAREAVALGRLPYRPWWQWSEDDADEALIAAAMQRTDTAAFAERTMATLSSGEQQRVWIASALAQRAPTLLLDEPTSHLDLAGAYATLDLLHGLADDGAAVAVVLHDLNLAAATADRLILVGEGRLLADGPVNDVFREDLLSLAYGAPIGVHCTTDGGLAAVPRRTHTRIRSVSGV
jgi:iron complex transport system ATP-binding protein